MREIDVVVIHHSAGPSGSVASIREEHRKRGWADIGYHEVIGNGKGAPDGHIGKGRNHSEVGAGVFGANTGKLHVCLIGNFAAGDAGYSGPPSAAQLDALGHWIMVNCKRYEVPTTNVRSHKEVALPGHGTLCPGFKDTTLVQIRRWAHMRLAGLESASLSAWLNSNCPKGL